MKLRATMLALCLGLAAPAGAQKSPAEVTDAQIKEYKATAESGCREGGKTRGDPPEKVNAFCKCMTGVFEKNMTKSEWQQVYFFSKNKQAADEENVLGPHMSKLRACRPPS